jgi:uncharacterized membrane protein
MPRVLPHPPSGHRFRLRKSTHRKSGKRLVLRRVPKPQSFLGTLSIVLALMSLFLMGVDGLLKLQSGHGAAAAFDYLKTYIMPAEFFGGIAGFVCGVFSFGLSKKRQRNAVIGLVLNGAILIGWFFLRSYLR